MTIKIISFREQVTLGGLGGMSSWNHEKHSKTAPVSIAQGFVVFDLGAKHGRVRVPMSNVVYILEAEAPAKEPDREA